MRSKDEKKNVRGKKHNSVFRHNDMALLPFREVDGFEDPAHSIDVRAHERCKTSMSH